MPFLFDFILLTTLLLMPLIFWLWIKLFHRDIFKNQRPRILQVASLKHVDIQLYFKNNEWFHFRISMHVAASFSRYFQASVIDVMISPLYILNFWLDTYIHLFIYFSSLSIDFLLFILFIFYFYFFFVIYLFIIIILFFIVDF